MDTGAPTSGDAAGASAPAPVTINFRKSVHKGETLDLDGYSALWHVCGVPLHARLAFNKDVENCVENRTLPRKKALHSDPDLPLDMEELENAMNACRKLFYPFIAQLVQAMEGPSVPAEVDGIVPSQKDGAYRVQLKTVGGALVPVHHDEDSYKRREPPGPVTDPAPGVPKVAGSKVHVEKELGSGMAIVCVDGERRFLKQVYGASTQGSFIREATVLSQLAPHPHVVTLMGLVVLPDGAVDGMLLELIDGVTLEAWQPPDGQQVDQCLKDRWLEQIQAGLNYVHSRGQVWGDVKPSNVLIDKRGDAHLIDFGGGFTAGWVPRKNVETTAGDHIGMMKIRESVQNMRTGE